MIPKGLAAAVLATMPEQLNIERGMEIIPGATTIKYVTYSVVFISILFTSILILLMDRMPLLRRFYSFFFGKMSESQENSDKVSQNSGNEEEKQTDIFHEVAGIFGRRGSEKSPEVEGTDIPLETADNSSLNITTEDDEN